MAAKSKHHGANYHISPTGAALATASAHSSQQPMTLYGACFCPFVQRVWAALELLGIEYQYVEVDPYKKPKELVEVSPKGLVPALRLNGLPRRARPEERAAGIAESTVIMDFLQDLAVAGGAHGGLLPPLEEPYQRAQARSLGDRVNRALVPAFYRYLQAQEPEKQVEHGRAFRKEVEELVAAFPGKGPWAVGDRIGWADLMAAPWIFRSTNVLVHYRGYVEPDTERYEAWRDAIFDHPAFRATTSTEELYLDSYARYAENRPNTSQVADAINSGRSLP